MVNGRCLAVLGVASLAACAAPPAPRPAVAAAHVPAAPEGVDGQYRGIARLVQASIAGCPRSGSRLVTVESNALSLTYRGPTASYALAAVVDPDGSIHGSDGRGSIDGKITGRHMDLIVSSQYCEVRYALDKL